MRPEAGLANRGLTRACVSRAISRFCILRPGVVAMCEAGGANASAMDACSIHEPLLALGDQRQAQAYSEWHQFTRARVHQSVALLSAESRGTYPPLLNIKLA